MKKKVRDQAAFVNFGKAFFYRKIFVGLIDGDEREGGGRGNLFSKYSSQKSKIGSWHFFWSFRNRGMRNTVLQSLEKK